jgi:hypothetical protein
MLNLKNIRKTPPAQQSVEIPTPMIECTPMPMVTSVLPEKPYETPASFDFNLVRIVEEHGPKRLEQIDAEIKRYEEKIATLQREREKVQAIVLALK